MAAQRVARFSSDGQKIACTLILKNENPTVDLKNSSSNIDSEKSAVSKAGPITETKLKTKSEIVLEPVRGKKRAIEETEEERILKRQKRFGNVKNEEASTTVVINGSSIISRNGKVEERKYPKAVYSTSDNPSCNPFTLEGFEVEETGFKSIPMNFFNRSGPLGWMGPAGVIVDYVISKGMMKEPPWTKHPGDKDKPAASEEPEEFFRGFRRKKKWD